MDWSPWVYVEHNILSFITHRASIPCLLPLLLIKNTMTTLREHPANKAVSNWCERSTKGDMSGDSSHGAVALGQTLCAPVLQRQLVRQNTKATQWGGGKQHCKGNWIWLLHVLTVDSSANLCHGRSQLSMCSSGCAGKSLGNQVTGWCQSFPGYSLRTMLATQVECEHWEIDEGEKREWRGKIREGKTKYMKTEITPLKMAKLVCGFIMR